MCVNHRTKAEFAKWEAEQETLAYMHELAIEDDHEIGAFPLNGNSLNFVLAGNATFTIVNTDTGNRFTFKVVQPDKHKPHFVRVLTGSDNENDFTFLGTIFDRQTYRHGKRSPINPTAQSAKVFAWAWPRILAHKLPEQIELWHEGRCGRCGRKLTVPESIQQGFGPECIQYVS